MNCSEDFGSGNIELIAFTSQGFALAQRLAEMLGRNGFALWGNQNHWLFGQRVVLAQRGRWFL